MIKTATFIKGNKSRKGEIKGGGRGGLNTQKRGQVLDPFNSEKTQ